MMAILKVARLGHPVLRQRARPLKAGEIAQAAVQRLIDDMVETMREYEGVGLAAPQVHQDLRLLVYEVDDNSRYPDRPNTDLNVLINPTVELVDGEIGLDWEGCLSLPHFRGIVPRTAHIRVKSLDRNGKLIEFEAEDFEARVIQHEVDHLDGVMFLDRMTDLQSLTYLAEYERFWESDEDEDGEDEETEA